MGSEVGNVALEQTEILGQIQSSLKSMQQETERLRASVEAIDGRVNVLTGVKSIQETIAKRQSLDHGSSATLLKSAANKDAIIPNEASSRPSSPGSGHGEIHERKGSPFSPAVQAPSSKIILTTYPGQSGIDPIPMSWGHKDPAQRGPVVVSRAKSTVRRRNAIGAHGGSYAIYHALAVASKNLDVDHKPDFTNTEPAANIGPFPQWCDPEKIVAMDPLGHLSPWLYNDIVQHEHVDIRPSIAVTKAHMKLPELEQSVRQGRLVPDGKICLNETGELAVTKFAVEPVWYLPGVAKRFGIGTCSTVYCKNLFAFRLLSPLRRVLEARFSPLLLVFTHSRGLHPSMTIQKLKLGRRRYIATLAFRKYRWQLPRADYQR